MSQNGILRGIAWRSVDGDAMMEVQQCEVLPGRGITTENRKAGKREITLISKERWQQTCAELGTTLPWHTRRANLLIEGLDPASLIGQVINIGDQVTIRIHGETKPCGIMDQQHAGLRKTLEPDFRGGVFGQVLNGGTLRTGDRVTLFVNGDELNRLIAQGQAAADRGEVRDGEEVFRELLEQNARRPHKP